MRRCYAGLGKISRLLLVQLPVNLQAGSGGAQIALGNPGGTDIAVDIAGEWKEALEKEGLQVDCRLEGLGEIPEIQDLYISHIRSAEPWHLTD